MANVTIEFDAANPLVVRIAIKGKDETHETDPTGWDINVSDEHFFRGKSHKEKMRERIELNKAIIDDWDTRKVQGAPAPHFLDPHHGPVVVRSGETVRFLCQRPFKIWVQREPHVTPELSSPESPFVGWTTTQDSGNVKVNDDYTVTAIAANGITAQRFYKCTAWIDIGDRKTVLVDPDVIGD